VLFFRNFRRYVVVYMVAYAADIAVLYLGCRSREAVQLVLVILIALGLLPRNTGFSSTGAMMA
jgi:hypothetical protein